LTAWPQDAKVKILDGDLLKLEKHVFFFDSICVPPLRTHTRVPVILLTPIFADFPEDLWVPVFEHLSYSERANISTVCKSWLKLMYIAWPCLRAAHQLLLHLERCPLNTRVLLTHATCAKKRVHPWGSDFGCTVSQCDEWYGLLKTGEKRFTLSVRRSCNVYSARHNQLDDECLPTPNWDIQISAVFRCFNLLESISIDEEVLQTFLEVFACTQDQLLESLVVVAHQLGVPNHGIRCLARNYVEKFGGTLPGPLEEWFRLCGEVWMPEIVMKFKPTKNHADWYKKYLGMDESFEMEDSDSNSESEAEAESNEEDMRYIQI